MNIIRIVSKSKKYTPKRTKLHYLKIFLGEGGGGHAPEPPYQARGYATRHFPLTQIPKKFRPPLPNPAYSHAITKAL